jgi:16S rRNA (adenine1518-N6/adenine1519-N6)-dimethyltransferase
MNRLTSPADVRRALESIGVRPSRRLGQNFLIDRNIRDILLTAAGLAAHETAFEIGPGLGVVTEGLAERAGALRALEKDPRLAAWLTSRFTDRPGVRIVEGDALDADLDPLLADAACCVSNLPYVTGNRILVRLAQHARRPPRLAVTVQWEVAQRLAARPGEAEYGLLSVWIQQDYSVRVVHRVSPTCFWPVPEVTSAIVSLQRRPDAPGRAGVRDTFYAITRTAFTHRRKQLLPALAGGRRPRGEDAARLEAALASAGVRAETRPESLDPGRWWALADALTPAGDRTM